MSGDDKEVGAVEDLMREHGVLRRALLVYRHSAARLRGASPGVDPAALNTTARLFRTFGEDYHEKALEEVYIFSTVKKAAGPAALYPDVLVAQHNRGREITDYILTVTANRTIASGHVEPLARAFEHVVLMYEHHAAREDTIVFPAWKDAISAAQFHELSEKFEDIEHEMFGEDGFEEALKRMADVEGALGLSDLSQFTAPPPPRA